MSINNINKNILSVKILDSINTNLGVDNSYASSKTKLIADALSEEIANISSSTVTTMDRYSVSTANGFYLDIIGSEEYIYRNKTPYITSDENVSYIYPLIDGEGFDDLLIGKEIIQTGEQVTIDSNYIVTFLRPVVVVSKFSNVQCYIRLEAYDVDSNILSQKYPTSYYSLSSVFACALSSVNIVRIDNSRLTYSSLNDKFNVSWIGADLNGMNYLFSAWFNFVSDQITFNSDQVAVFKSSNTPQTFNFYYSLSGLTNFALVSSTNSSIVVENNTISFN